MTEGSQWGRQSNVWRYVAVYALYALLLILSYLVFMVWQRTILLLVSTLLESDSAVVAVHSIVVILIGLGLFVLVIAAEPYLRGGLRRRQVGSRFARLAVPLGATIVLGILLRELLYRLP